MRKHIAIRLSACLTACAWCLAVTSGAAAAKVQNRYYARAPVHDKYRVIAPWYAGQNGQCDFRVRVAAETLKRYPWTGPPNAVAAAPHFVFSGRWQIAPDGRITPRPIDDWANGDLGQRAAYVLSGLVDYYRYTGDPAAVALLTVQADALLDRDLTPPDHPWPRFPVSVPVKGKPYGQADPRGMIQLDIAAEMGLALLQAYQVTGNARWLQAASHWGDLLAEHCDRRPGVAPWGRYANPESARWKDNKQTGGVVFVLSFLDELIRLGHTGADGKIVRARDAGRAYLGDVLLPAWTVNDTWGRNYWDWVDAVQAENVTEFAARYLMDHPAEFPNWHCDARNVLTLFFHRTGACPRSAGEVYSGAWAFPESSNCCGRSLWYGPMELAVPVAQYAALTGSPWAREIARRMQILATYDAHATGVSEDNIDGGFVVCGDWFKIAHPMALKHVLGTMAWLPEELGASRENHVVRSSAVVVSVVYGKGHVAYSTFDAPANTVDVLRLAFAPRRVLAGARELPARRDLDANGYTVKTLAGGDRLVRVRHDGAKDVVVEGDDPQQVADDAALKLTGEWSSAGDSSDFGGTCRIARHAGAAAEIAFTGNQVRLVGRAAPDGGLADVYLDGVKQLVAVDCWNPAARHQQVLYYRNGLAGGPHTLKIVARGAGNPRSAGSCVYVDAVQFSDATGSAGFGEGGGPTGPQRMVFGYPGRRDIKDSAGNLWRPATEWIVRLGSGADSVARAWWTTPAAARIEGTPDPELYRYGVHGRQLVVNVTVGPGTYHVRLKFAVTRGLDTKRNCVNVAINGRSVVNKLDVAATAGGPNKAVDLVFQSIAPRNGVIDVTLTGGDRGKDQGGEAFLQGLEVGPGDGGRGAVPKSAD